MWQLHGHERPKESQIFPPTTHNFVPPALTIQDSFQHPSHQIRNPGFWVEKSRERANYSF